MSSWFFTAATGDPYCVAQLGELQSLRNKQDSGRSQNLAVSIDSHAESKKLRQKLQAANNGNQTFPLLQNTGQKVIDRYGLLIRTAKAGLTQLHLSSISRA